MADIISQRETFIVVGDGTGLYPSEDLYPSPDLYPQAEGNIVLTNIVAGSLKFSSLIAENVPQFGKIYASKFECTVFLTPDIKGKRIQVYQIEGVNYTPIFTGIIDSCKLDNLGTDRKIIAYDYSYQLSKVNIAEWWTGYWKKRTTSTLKQCRESMCQYFDVDYEDVELPHDDLAFPKSVDLTNCSFTEMLRMMCELNYCFPHFDGYGKLVFIVLQSQGTSGFVTKNLVGKYEIAKSSFETYKTADIVGMQFYDSTDNLKQTTGKTTNAYPVRKNVFLYEANAPTLDLIGSSFLSLFSQINYTPATVKMISSDLTLELGDFVHTERGDFYIFQNSLSGSQFFEQTLKAKGAEVLYAGTKNLNYSEIILGEKYARLQQDVNQFQIEYGNFREQTSSRFTMTDKKIETEVKALNTKDGDLSSKITQTAAAIRSEVKQVESNGNKRMSTIEQTAKSITTRVEEVNTNGNKRMSTIEQTAKSITTRVENVEKNKASKSQITQLSDSIEAEVKQRKNDVNGVTQKYASLSLSVNGIVGRVETLESDGSTFKSSLEMTDKEIKAEVKARGNLETAVSNLKMDKDGVFLNISKNTLKKVLNLSKNEKDKDIINMATQLNTDISVEAGKLKAEFTAHTLDSKDFKTTVKASATSVSTTISETKVADAIDTLFSLDAKNKKDWKNLTVAERKAIVGSRIDQKIDQITLEVVNGVDAKGNESKTSSKIALMKGKTVIKAYTLAFEGYATFSSLLDKQKKTIINGANIQTGTIDVSCLKAGTIDATKIKVTNLSADNIKSGTFTVTDKALSGAAAIRVMKNSNEIVGIDADSGIIVGKSFGDNKTFIDGDGIRLAKSAKSKNDATVVMTSGKLTLGNDSTATNTQTKITTGSIYLRVANGSKNAIQISSNGTKAALTIEAKGSGSAINVTKGQTILQDVNCTGLTIEKNTFNTAKSANTIQYYDSFTGATEYSIDANLWVINASSTPTTKKVNGVYGFEKQPVFKKLTLNTSTSKQFFIVKSKDTTHVPKFNSITVLATAK